MGRPIMNVQDFTDEQLAGLDDAINADWCRRQHLQDPTIAASLAALSDEEHLELSDRVDAEIMDRADRALAVQVSHELEQGEAREQLGDDDRRACLVRRAAQFFKLARLNAPDPILCSSFRLLAKVAPEGAKS